jgi:hypothetical protein
MGNEVWLKTGVDVRPDTNIPQAMLPAVEFMRHANSNHKL